MSKSNATKSILGFEYQKLVALVECLNAKPDCTIFLECYGDISDGTSSTEVKHSTDSTKELYDTHEDFWNTLSNIVTDRITFCDYTEFVLHTTAKIRTNSIFENWNNIDENIKESRIKKVLGNKTIQKYIDNINSCDTTELQQILKRFVIKDSQPNSRQYYREVLLKHPLIQTVVEEKYQEKLALILLGYISKNLITSEDYVWKINKNLFTKDYQSFIKDYQIENFIFPNIQINEADIKDRGYRFTKELEEIKYHAKIPLALKHYLKSEKQRFAAISSRNSLADHLDKFDEEVFEKMIDIKTEHIDRSRNNMLLFNNNKQNSRRYYDAFMQTISEKREITGVENNSVKEYYPQGRALFNIEENKEFKLNLKK